MISVLAALFLLISTFQAPEFQAEDTQPLNATRMLFPTYPELARRLRLEGDYKVQILVDEQGLFVELELLEGDGKTFVLFDGILIEAFKEWRFEPSGQSRRLVVEFEFHLVSKKLPHGPPRARFEDTWTIITVPNRIQIYSTMKEYTSH